MTTEVDIDELLKQDEAELKAKKKRLRTVAATLEELRAATTKAAAAAADVIDSGDLARAEFAQVFALSKGERASLLPAAQRRSAKTADESLDGEEESHESNGDAAQHQADEQH